MFSSSHEPRFRRTTITVAAFLYLISGCRAPELAKTEKNDLPAQTVYRLPATTESEVVPTSEAFPIASGETAGAVPSASPKSPIQRTQFIEFADDDAPEQNPDTNANAADSPQPELLSKPLMPSAEETVGQDSYHIDLPTALALAGANNLQIAFAAERVQQAVAQMNQAELLWVPSINGGLMYNNHAGRIQATEGDVIEASRNSLFVGAGAVAGTSPLNGGSGGPARMFVDLPLVDVLFEPLATRRMVQAAEAQQGATFNNTLLQVSVAYLNLLQSQSQVAIARETVKNAKELAAITADFASAGEGLEADAQRARAELNERRRGLLKAKESVAVASAELVRLLRLDPTVILVPNDRQVGPLEIVDDRLPLRHLIARAMAVRPEIARQGALAERDLLRLRQERWRPWMPNLHAGFSGGGFGGDQGNQVNAFSDRTDFDLGAIWELQNLGLGNRARQREQQSAYDQAQIAVEQVRDVIASEVSRAYHQVKLRREQIEVAQHQVGAATEALTLNFDGIRGKALRPIEAQQAIGALAAARQSYLSAVIDYNRAQFELLRALGRPTTAPSDGAESP